MPPSSSICGAVERLEVAVLVEDVVGRQQRLAEALVDAAAAQRAPRVEERPSLVGRVRLGQADEHRRLARQLARERVRARPSCCATKSCAEQQIARQIADERELRRDRQVGAARRRLADGVGDQPRVAGEVADGRVDLQQRDFHG